MHILEIPSFFPPSGGLFCLDQAKALASLGHTVRILSNVQLGITIGAKNYISLPLGRYEHVMDGITVYQSYQRGIPKAIRYNVNHWIEIVCSMYQDYELCGDEHRQEIWYSLCYNRASIQIDIRGGVWASSK